MSADMIRDTLAERLMRRPAKPMGSARVGSNPTGVVFFWFLGVKRNCIEFGCILFAVQDTHVPGQNLATSCTSRRTEAKKRMGNHSSRMEKSCELPCAHMISDTTTW